MRSWGEELWDQWDAVTTHSQKGIDFLDMYCRFVKERSSIESDYAKNLRKLVKTFLPKKKEEADRLTVQTAFRDSVNETGDIAGQHELIAEDLNVQVVVKIHELIRELKDERKKSMSEGLRLQNQLQLSYQQLEKSKKVYEKAFREAEKAQDNYQRADADLNLSRAEVEKQRMNASIKNQNCEDYKNEYANQLQKTNTLQSDHYTKAMPDVFTSLQTLDMKRIKDIKNMIIKTTDIERSVYPILLKCLEGIVAAANSIDEAADSETVIERYKSGFVPPVDVPFDDLSTSRQNGSDGGSGGDTNSLPGHQHNSNHSTPTAGHPPFRSDTIKGTISATKFRKRANLFQGIFGSNKHNNSFNEKDDFSELPPNQRKKKIQQKIEDLNSKLTQETASRDALLKMKEVYEGNPSLGDPLTVNGQLRDSCTAIDKLKLEIEKYLTMLDHPDPPAPSPTPPSRHHHQPAIAASPNTIAQQPSSQQHHHHNGSGSHASPRSSLASHRTSFSEESISRSASSSSLCTQTPPQAPPPPQPASTISLAGRPASTTTTTTTTTTSTTTTTTSTTSTATSRSTLLCAANTGGAAGQTNTSTSGSSHSPESGIGLSHNSLPGSEVEVVNGGSGGSGGRRDAAAVAAAEYDAEDEGDGNGGTEDESAEFYDVDPLPVIGTCRALYAFDGVSEGSMAVAEGESLQVIELDAGDGWTRVRRPPPDATEGFVPTTYIQVTLNSNC